MPLPDFTPDINGKLSDAGLVTSSAAWQVSSAAKVFDTGAAAFFPFSVLIKVLAIEIASNNELYRLIIQGSSSATFASTIVNLVELDVGANEVIVGGADVDSTTGDYILYGHNNYDGTNYRYLRGYSVISGTIATGISLEAWLGALKVG